MSTLFHSYSAYLYISNLLISLSLILQISYGQLINQYEKDIGTKGEDIWRSQNNSVFIPMQSQSFGTIKIGREMSAEFDFVWHGYTFSERGTIDPTSDNYFEMFFRIGCSAYLNSSNAPCSGGNNCAGQGARYPSFWVSPPGDPAGSNTSWTPKMHVSVSSGTDCQPGHELTGWGEIYIGTQYHVKIWFNDTKLIVGVGHTSNYTSNPSSFPEWEVIWDREPTQAKYLGVNVPVWWMSNKNTGIPYNVGNGTFSNVVITSNRFLEFPTNEPSMEPTISPTEYPSIEPTFATDSPSEYPSTNPSYSPTSSPTISTIAPSVYPSQQPSNSPSDITSNPSITPTNLPTISPTFNPSKSPSITPSISPSVTPSMNPSTSPTISPSNNPSLAPVTSNPTPSPVDGPIICAENEDCNIYCVHSNACSKSITCPTTNNECNIICHDYGCTDLSISCVANFVFNYIIFLRFYIYLFVLVSICHYKHTYLFQMVNF